MDAMELGCRLERRRDVRTMHTMTKKLLARAVWPFYSFNVDLLNRNAQMLSRVRDYERKSSPVEQYGNRAELYSALNERRQGGAVTYCEFGVWKGASLENWAKINTHPESRFYGFDSFEGFPEVWEHGFGHRTGKEHFSLGGVLPNVSDSRIKLIKGWFQDTLGSFLAETELLHPMTVHVDCDLYSSALFVLATLNPVLKAGDVVIFDEFSSPANEFLAWEDYQRAFLRKAECIAMSDRWSQVAFALVN